MNTLGPQVQSDDVSLMKLLCGSVVYVVPVMFNAGLVQLTPSLLVAIAVNRWLSVSIIS